MIEFHVELFYRVLRLVEGAEKVVAPGVPTETTSQRLALGILDEAEGNCKLLGLPQETLMRIEKIRDVIKSLASGTPADSSFDLKYEFKVLAELIVTGVKQRHFLYLPPDKFKYWENPEWFGDEVVDAFLMAYDDMGAAGNCYATDNYTACVFHAVRVAEHGMRKLARHLGIKKGIKNRPLEYEEWGQIIQLLDAKLNKLRNARRGPKRDRSLQFYTSAFRHCQHLNDLWRKDVSHARKTYEHHQALGAIEHARDFMRLMVDLARRDNRKQKRQKAGDS